MYSPAIIAEAIVNGLMTGAVYALIALGLTLVYGVLHIINFAHGALLTAAMFAVWAVYKAFGLDPYLAILPLTPLFFGLGYAVQRFVIGPASHGSDSQHSTRDARPFDRDRERAASRVSLRYAHSQYRLWLSGRGTRPASPLQPRLSGLGRPCWLQCSVASSLAHRYRQGDPGRRQGEARRQPRRHRRGPCLRRHLRPGLRLPSRGGLPAHADLLRQSTHRSGLRAGCLHHRRSRRHGSSPGALLGGLFIGVVESLCGLFLGDSLGQIGIFLIFILVLLVRPTGMFGAKA